MNPLTTLLLLVLIGSTSNAFQENEQLFSRVDQSFQQNEPKWKVERVYPSNTSDTLTHNVVYRSKLGQAAVDITIWRREQDARDVFSGETIAFDNTGGKKKLKRSLLAVGDENYIWTNPHSSVWPMIKFRKGRILVSVFAPTVTIAKRFADHVLKQIDASKHALGADSP